jgi:glycosyltransferase involved in cell wall biosynthesis
MKLCFLTKYDTLGASSRYRFYQYFKYFNENGIICKYYSLFDNKYLSKYYSNERISIFSLTIYFIKRLLRILKLKSFDLIVIEKEIFPYFPSFFEWYLKCTKIKYIVDYDDAIFHNYDISNNKLIRLLLSKKIPKVIKHANYVINGSKYLNNYSKTFNSNYCLIPTSIELKKYNHSDCYTNSDTIIIGWIGSKSTSQYIINILPALTNFMTSTQSVLLKLIGFDQKLEYKLKEINYVNIPWSEKTEVEHLHSISIGIMPLDDGPWEQGKCGFKLIQYMACKKPVIASPVGANLDIVEDGLDGYFASSNSEWTARFTWFYNNKNKLKVMGQNGYNKVAKRYCVESNYTKYIKIFNSCVKEK